MNMRYSILRKLTLVIVIIVCFTATFGETAEMQDGLRILFTTDGPVWDGGDISWENQVLTLRGEGSYILSGTCEKGRISVEAGKKGSVVLILDGLSIASDQERALEIVSADEVTILLTEDSENRIEARDGEGATALYAKGDLTIRGLGSLTVISVGKHGIQATGGVTIQQSDLMVTAAACGIRARRDIYISSGTMTVISGSDGILTSGETEKQEGGNIRIDGGIITIQAEKDGISAGGDLQLTGGAIDITAGGGYRRAKPRKKETGEQQQSDLTEEEEETSRKGLKCRGFMDISGGTITVDSADDAIHSDDTIQISGGTVTAMAGDDGIHANHGLEISGADVQLNQSYEGMEAGQILISGGTTIIVAQDDGLNASIGENAEKPDVPELTITGGTLYINAEGDGIDSNGSISIRGGNILIDGPSSGMDGALDAGRENGGKLVITDGEILAVGAARMAEAFDERSRQHSFQYNGIAFKAGDMIRIENEKGKVIAEHQAIRSGDSVVYSCSSLSAGSRIRLTIGMQSEWIELTGITTTIEK